MRVLSKNRLDDARNLGFQFFFANNQQPPKKPILKPNMMISARCDQGNYSREPTPSYYDTIYSMSEEYKIAFRFDLLPVWKFVVSQITPF